MKREILFLKCFSDKEPRKDGTYKFSQQEIKKIFEKEFIIELEYSLLGYFEFSTKTLVCSNEKEVEELYFHNMAWIKL
jgi:hypothetical protein